MKIARVQVDNIVTYAILNQDLVFTKAELEKSLKMLLPEFIGEFGQLILTKDDIMYKISQIVEGKAQSLGLLRLDQVKLLPPLDNRPKVICVGLNYRDHAEESKAKPPAEPVIFMKPYTAITGPFDPIEYPAITSQVDYECELGVVIGRKCKNVGVEEAFDYILGYTVFNDVSARDIQFRDGQWIRGKSFDTFAPVGPWIVTKDDVPDPHSLKMMTIVDGEIRQNSTTANMIFKVHELVSFISKVMTLDPGDIIATGTPAGVGVFAKPVQKLLKIGQVVEVEIESVGRIKNKVVKAK